MRKRASETLIDAIYAVDPMRFVITVTEYINDLEVLIAYG